MKKIFILILSLTVFTSAVFSQCGTINAANMSHSNDKIIFLVFSNATLAESFLTSAGGEGASITCSPGGAGTITTSNNNKKLRIDATTTAGTISGEYVGTIETSQAPTFSCTFTALPVSLTSFTAKKMEQSILLEWETASEINNDYFSVERSIDGRHFEELTAVSGKGNNVGQVAYDFEDKKPKPATNYYRLRQVDFDGTASFSEVISVDFKDTRLNLNLYPTLVRDEINFDLTNFENETVAIKVLNATGHVVLSETRNSSEVFTLHLADLNLSEGMYYVHCQLTNRTTIGKFLVVK